MQEGSSSQEREDAGGLYAVVPLPTCPHLEQVSFHGKFFPVVELYFGRSLRWRRGVKRRLASLLPLYFIVISNVYVIFYHFTTFTTITYPFGEFVHLFYYKQPSRPVPQFLDPRSCRRRRFA
ncbi:hypothetical protein Y032_0060g3141 [Ancylostoma ceylanicum]|uniref:Uncharacterized protein n=1 Tax=Ancylostoma ceylanicum TaxID=53326 RepID=A0A016U4E4_9BILA|nr:hypothetical protein Y032_0060g3141 [Ancylostoma ceylanicum]